MAPCVTALVQSRWTCIQKVPEASWTTTELVVVGGQTDIYILCPLTSSNIEKIACSDSPRMSLSAWKFLGSVVSVLFRFVARYSCFSSFNSAVLCQFRSSPISPLSLKSWVDHETASILTSLCCKVESLHCAQLSCVMFCHLSFFLFCHINSAFDLFAYFWVSSQEEKTCFKTSESSDLIWNICFNWIADWRSPWEGETSLNLPIFLSLSDVLSE